MAPEVARQNRQSSVGRVSSVAALAYLHVFLWLRRSNVAGRVPNQTYIRSEIASTVVEPGPVSIACAY